MSQAIQSYRPPAELTDRSTKIQRGRNQQWALDDFAEERNYTVTSTRQRNTFTLVDEAAGFAMSRTLQQEALAEHSPLAAARVGYLIDQTLLAASQRHGAYLRGH